jgi:hypothetical protein
VAVAPGWWRIPPRIILPASKKMRTKSARWGKIIHGGTRKWVGW